MDCGVPKHIPTRVNGARPRLRSRSASLAKPKASTFTIMVSLGPLNSITFSRGLGRSKREQHDGNPPGELGMSLDETAINRGAQPCDDLYEFAC